MNKTDAFFVSGIGTSVGKTICSAILAQWWKTAYWKPVQSGDLQASDSMMVKRITTDIREIYQPRFELNTACSPHRAAELDGQKITLSDFTLPKTTRSLIIEGAGGLFVPLNEKDFIIDLIRHLQLPVVLVCQDYLGCINHTILSIKALLTSNIPLSHIVFNGEFESATKSIIIANLPKDTQVIEIPWLEKLGKKEVLEVVNKLKNKKK